MNVGNGFHEVRNQTDEKMAEVFSQYHSAGILIIFTEETGLTDDQLLATAWNTYHAGFRYMHDLSGQGLRTYNRRGRLPRQLSWQDCARAGGYEVLERFTSKGRAIFPLEPGADNPAISVNYFCVPKR